jgi:hypothetical protein
MCVVTFVALLVLQLDAILLGSIIIDALSVVLLVFASWFASQRNRPAVDYRISGEFLVSWFHTRE